MRLLTPLIFLLWLFPSTVSAQEQPKGNTILVVSGVASSGRVENIAFDLAMLETLPQHSVTTQNPWARGLNTYQGFSAVDLLALFDSQASLLQVSALNKYMTEIPIKDFVENGAIFATHQNGLPMSVRNLGPIMVIYPFDDQENLKSEVFYGRSIWQVSQIKLISSLE